ncbi:MAG: helix-turn-helix transcriptional regulator [Oscillospiraceae bacterium]|nr:helix-turn-helix transcriptional regulator [Oscillospiraceae bacterium]
MDKKAFLKRLSEERKRRGYTQKQLAELLGVSDRTYSKWETGVNEMDVSSLCRLAGLYGKSPAVFFPDPDAPEPDGARAELASLPIDEAAARWFRLHYDAILGMDDAMRRYYTEHPDKANQPPPKAAPPERPEPAILTFLSPDLVALAAAGPEQNFSVLLQPNAAGWSWLKTDGERLIPYFRLLAMPGMIACFAVILSHPSDVLLGADRIASEAGVPPDAAAKALEEAAALRLLSGETVLRGGKELRLYQSPAPVVLLGLITLAKHLLGGSPLGHGCGAWGAGSPWIRMKGENDDELRR